MISSTPREIIKNTVHHQLFFWYFNSCSKLFKSLDHPNEQCQKMKRRNFGSVRGKGEFHGSITMTAIYLRLWSPSATPVT